ncbi:transposase family protein [Halomonas sp. CS7]|uniref:Transposase family protein n=1 Tax=Halomonas pelophila TaxID=3151122 RepID=A0ABV1N3E2_9GAMM
MRLMILATRSSTSPQYGDFEAGAPSHDTFARVMALVNTDQLQSAFAEWVMACHDLTEGAVVTIDGKTLRRSYCRGQGQGRGRSIW